MSTRNFVFAGIDHNWSTAGTWDTVPVDGDTVVIGAGQTCNYDGDMSNAGAWPQGVNILLDGILATALSGGPYTLKIIASITLGATGVYSIGQTVVLGWPAVFYGPTTPAVATRYISLRDLKAYITSNHVNTAIDDAMLYQAISRAEGAIDEHCGSRFDIQTFTNVQPFLVFVDGNGTLKLVASEVGPVTAVQSIQILNVGMGEKTWRTITWDPVNEILLPPIAVPPKANSWDVLITNPHPTLQPAYTGSLYAKWTYTGGYGTLGGSPDLPNALKAIVTRLSFFYYQLREAPMGKTINADLGLVTIPSSIPPDIKAELEFWKRQAG